MAIDTDTVSASSWLERSELGHTDRGLRRFLLVVSWSVAMSTADEAVLLAKVVAHFRRSQGWISRTFDREAKKLTLSEAGFVGDEVGLSSGHECLRLLCYSH